MGLISSAATPVVDPTKPVQTVQDATAVGTPSLADPGTQPTYDPGPATTPGPPETTYGLSPAPVATGNGDATPGNVSSVVKPAEYTGRELTAKETVSGQLNDLLNEDSKYMQSATANALAQANGRGLINSSMAVGAGQKAAIDSALPIAQQDATTNATSGQLAQQGNQDTTLTGYKSLLDSAQGKENSGYRIAEAQQNIDANKALQTERLGSDLTRQTQSEAAAVKLQNDKMASDLQRQTQQETANATLQLALKQADVNLDTSKMNSTEKQALGVSLEKNHQQLLAELSKIDATADSVMNGASKAAAKDFLINEYKNFANTQASLYGSSVSWDAGSSGTVTINGTGTNTGTGTTTTTGNGAVTPIGTPLPSMATATEANIASAYQQYLGRVPSAAEVAQWTQYGGSSFSTDFMAAAATELAARKAAAGITTPPPTGGGATPATTKTATQLYEEQQAAAAAAAAASSAGWESIKPNYTNVSNPLSGMNAGQKAAAVASGKVWSPAYNGWVPLADAQAQGSYINPATGVFEGV